MKKRIRTNRMRYILVSGLIALVGLGIGISCSKDSGISSLEPDPRVTKPTVVDFHLQTGDPFSEMSLDDRRNAIGGPEVAEQYLRIIGKQLARAMMDEGARNILYSITPDINDGGIHITTIADTYPYILGLVSEGFKDAIAQEGLQGKLAGVIKDASSDAEAIYKASRGLFELEIAIATPAGERWNPANPIPVVFPPVSEDTTVVEGVDVNLQPISLPAEGETPPRTCLVLNFDEDMFVPDNAISISSVPEHESLWASWQDIWNAISLVPSAYAHYPSNHHSCYHENIIQPVKAIVIYDDHESWAKGKPEIYINIVWRYPNEPVEPYLYSLEDVDHERVYYTNYAHLRTQHGTCGVVLQTVRVFESDYLREEILGRWTNVSFPSGDPPNEKALSTDDVYLLMVETDEDK